MPIILSDYDKLLECKGNKHNQIFVVQHKESLMKFILKVIDIYQKDSQLREIEVHMKLNHKYVIKLIDYEFRDNKILMLIEYAKHGDLYGFLPKTDTLGEAKILKMYYRVLKALEYLHANNFVHRDIKPENILITSNFKPKLADFGTSVNKSIIANTFCGTYEYMAPEVYLRCKQTDKVDVWAVGILLYELFHQKTPFREDTLQTIKEKLDARSISFNPDLRQDIKNFIYSALEFNSLERPSITSLLKHSIFDQFRPKQDRKSTATTQQKAPYGSMMDLEDFRTSSQPKFENTGNTIKLKMPVHTEIFDTEFSNKNVENFSRKLQICKESTKSKPMKASQSYKNLIVTICKPKAKEKVDGTKCKATLLKKLRTLNDISMKPELYPVAPSKRKINVIMSLNNLDYGNQKKTVALKGKTRAPSIGKDLDTSLNKKPKESAKSGIQGILFNIYERKPILTYKTGTYKVK